MTPYDGPAVNPPPVSAAPRRNRRWLIPGLLARAFVLMLGVGMFVGATMLTTATAALQPRGLTFDSATGERFSLRAPGCLLAAVAGRVFNRPVTVAICGA